MAEAVALFFDAPWTWVSVGMAGVMRTNIDRVQLEASARLLGIEDPRAHFSDIRAMEDEAIKAWSRRGV